MVAAAGSAGEYDDAPAINLDHLLSIGRYRRRRWRACARSSPRLGRGSKRRSTSVATSTFIGRTPALEASGRRRRRRRRQCVTACTPEGYSRPTLEAMTPLTPGSAVRVKMVAPPRRPHACVRALLEGTDGHAVRCARTRWSDASAEIETPPPRAAGADGAAALGSGRHRLGGGAAAHLWRRRRSHQRVGSRV